MSELPTSEIDSAEPRRRSRLLTAVGAGVIVVGLVAAVVLFVVGQSRSARAVEQLARAPVGCDTTLEFTGSGTFVLYVETSGRIDPLDGGCDAPTTYDRRGAGAPVVSIEMFGPGGEEVALQSTDAADYSTDDFTGEARAEILIIDGGRHVLRVKSDDEDFAVSIGRDPSGVTTPFTVAAILVGLSGLIGGATLVAIAVARARRDPTDEPPSDDPPSDDRGPEFVPGGEAPTAVPLAPPPPGTIVEPPSGGTVATWDPPRPGSRPA